MSRECGFAHPPPDGSRDAEIVDRFRDFLAEAGPAPIKAAAAGPSSSTAVWRAPLSPAGRYRLRFLIWRMSRVALELTDTLEARRR